MPRRQLITAALLMGLGVLVAGCATSGVGSASPTPTSFTVTATPQPTVTAGADTATPTAVASAQACKAEPGALFLGELAVSKPEILYGFNADYMLPDGLPTDKPLTITTGSKGPILAGAVVQSMPVVQPVAFLVQICNTSATNAHHLGSFGATLTSATPYVGQLNVLNECALLYGRPYSMGGECASGYEPDYELTFQFAAAATAQATVTQSLPATLAPGQSVGVSFAIQPPKTNATMTFRLGIGVDGQAISYPAALTTQPAINAPIARRWAGDYCSAPSMLSQIPATTPANTYYICPQV